MVEQHIKALLPIDIQAHIVIGDLPSKPDNVIALILYDGVESTEYFHSGSILKPVIKFVVRNHSYEMASAQIETIKSTLHRYHDDYFASILMSRFPMYLGKDAQKIHEFQIVFNINVKE